MIRRRLSWFVALEVALCLLLVVIWPRPAVDDSFIFLTYARHLAVSGVFAFNPGEASYGFSSPAYVILLAVASRISGVPVGVGLSNALGILMCALAAFAVWIIWGEIHQQPPEREMFLSAILFSGPWFFTAWFIFGMETGLAVIAMLGFLLWLAKLRAGAARFPWLLIGIVATSVLATTRLESGVYVAAGIIFALVTVRSRSEMADLVIVGALAGGIETLWLLYAKHTFGTYMPWTSTARLLFYLPGKFGLRSAAQFYDLGVVGRTRIAIEAASQMAFGGAVKFLLVPIPFFTALWLLKAQRKPDVLRWMLSIVVIGAACEMIAFVYLFPLVQNRHLAPYIVSLWVLVVPTIARGAGQLRHPVHTLAIAACAVLWVAGAIHYRQLGRGLDPLYRLSASGLVSESDNVAAEPIGILAFETQAHIIDLGGLTDRDAWPMLMQGKQADLKEVIRWDIGKGADKLVLEVRHCSPQEPRFGAYCLVNAEDIAQGRVE